MDRETCSWWRPRLGDEGRALPDICGEKENTRKGGATNVEPRGLTGWLVWHVGCSPWACWARASFFLLPPLCPLQVLGRRRTRDKKQGMFALSTTRRLNLAVQEMERMSSRRRASSAAATAGTVRFRRDGVGCRGACGAYIYGVRQWHGAGSAEFPRPKVSRFTGCSPRQMKPKLILYFRGALQVARVQTLE